MGVLDAGFEVVKRGTSDRDSVLEPHSISKSNAVDDQDDREMIESEMRRGNCRG